MMMQDFELYSYFVERQCKMTTDANVLGHSPFS